MDSELQALISQALGTLTSEVCHDPATALGGLLAYAELLAKWNERSNLVGAGSMSEIVTEHILDSVAAASVMPPLSSTIDVGSGAGFPGIVLSILRPAHRIVLIEPRRRHASFLAESVRRLGLTNTSLFEGRVEDYIVEGSPTLWTSRAFSPIEDFFELLSSVVRAEDLLAFIGGLDSKIDGATAAGFVMKESLKYSKTADSKRVFVFASA